MGIFTKARCQYGCGRDRGACRCAATDGDSAWFEGQYRNGKKVAEYAKTTRQTKGRR